MKVFVEYLGADGNYTHKTRAADVTDGTAYRAASTAYPESPEYVTEMLDGRGYIVVVGTATRTTYQQDDL